MKLYCTLRSPYARKVRMLALEKGVDLQLIEEDLADRSDELLGCNPIGRIPVLVCDNGQVVSDSTLICEYLNECFNTPDFLPADKIERMKIKNLDSIAKGLTDVTVSCFYEKLKHPKDFNADFISGLEQTIIRSLRYFEQHIDDLKELTLAAISLLCAIGYINFRVPHLWPRSDCPRLEKWYEEHSKRPSFKKTIPQA